VSDNTGSTNTPSSRRRIDSDTGPFAIIPEWVIDLPISDRGVRLYALLARYADNDGFSWPSRKTLAQRLGKSVDVLDRAVKELQEYGALYVTPRYDEAGDRTSNGYTLVRARPANMQGGSRENTATGSREKAGTGSRENTALTRATINENQIELENIAPTLEVAAKVPAVRGRDEVWDTVMLVCGIGEGSITKSSRGAYNKSVKDLRDISATPRQIIERAVVFRRRWPDVSLTPTALSRRWPECDPDRQHQGRPSLPEEREQLARLSDAWEGNSND